MYLAASFDDQEIDTMKCYIAWLDEFDKLNADQQRRVLIYLKDRYPNAPIDNSGRTAKSTKSRRPS